MLLALLLDIISLRFSKIIPNPFRLPFEYQYKHQPNYFRGLGVTFENIGALLALKELVHVLEEEGLFDQCVVTTKAIVLNH